LIGLLIFTLPEPARRGQRQSAARRVTWHNSYGALIEFMRTQPRFFLAAAGVVGKLACGYAVDLMYRRGLRDAQLRWYAICLALATPVGIAATTTTNPRLCVIGITLLVTLLQPLPAVAFTALHAGNEIPGGRAL
jgi:hypothetical protein